MSRNYFYAVLCVTGLCLLLILAYFLGQKPAEKEKELLQPVRSPYPTHINGVGIVEPTSGNISIGIPFNRLVKKINVSVNQPVKKGDLLFQLDDQDLQAELRIKKAEYEKAVANLNKLQALPRKEDLTIAEAALAQAQAARNESREQYQMVTALPNPRAITKDEQDKRIYSYQAAEAQLKERQAQYEKVRDGASKHDLESAKQGVQQAKAAVEAVETEISRASIRSPIDGTVLQIKIHAGEMPGSDPNTPLMLVGDISQLDLRVSIDQFDLSHLKPNHSATAFRQGDHVNRFPLEFIRVEPVMVPKKYVTNAVSEKVDTQVLELLYRIAKPDPNLFVGEKMDVFIDVKK